MKKILIFCFVILILSSVKVVAHPASSMSIDYDIESKELIVSMTHIVADPADHYISNITIEKNNVFYKSFEYISQPTSSSFTYNYSGIDAEVGDMFSVVSICNKGGQKSAILTVGPSTGDSKTPGFEILFVIFAIVLVLFCKAKKIK